MRMKAGRYYIGDPCYVISEDNWSEFLGKIDFGHNQFPEQGIVVDGTAYGDGVYQDNFGRDYCVDAGMLGILAECYIEDDYKGFGHLVEFKEDFEVKINFGVFEFGPVVIDTENEELEEYAYS